MDSRFAKSITGHFFFACFCLAQSVAYGQAPSTPLVLRPDAPERYVVVRGDTLWGIAARYTDSPWRWPELWDMNKDQVKNPHLIYPGNVILLNRTAGRLALEGGEALRRPGAAAPGAAAAAPGAREAAAAGAAAPGAETVRLTPRIRAEFLEREPIPSIPYDAIAPFLVRPLIVEADALDNAPAIVGTENNRVVLAAQDVAYARGVDETAAKEWFVYRPGNALVDPDTKRTLGYEARYLGTAVITRPGPVATILLTSVVQEVVKGDKLVPAAEAHPAQYVPRAPELAVNGRVISIYTGIGNVGEAGPPDSVLTLNRGASDGIEIGHVLALLRPGGPVPGSRQEENLRLPDERYGVAFVFRVFEHVSYALVMQTTKPVIPFDLVQTP
jgi:nucleoid-associated protein YgaU